jgi:hypothetical protein
MAVSTAPTTDRSPPPTRRSRPPSRTPAGSPPSAAGGWRASSAGPHGSGSRSPRSSRDSRIPGLSIRSAVSGEADQLAVGVVLRRSSWPRSSTARACASWRLSGCLSRTSTSAPAGCASAPPRARSGASRCSRSTSSPAAQPPRRHGEPAPGRASPGTRRGVRAARARPQGRERSTGVVLAVRLNVRPDLGRSPLRQATQASAQRSLDPEGGEAGGPGERQQRPHVLKRGGLAVRSPLDVLPIITESASDGSGRNTEAAIPTGPSGSPSIG